MSKIQPMRTTNDAPMRAGAGAMFDAQSTIARVRDSRLYFSRAAINSDGSNSANQIELFTPVTSGANMGIWNADDSTIIRFEVSLSTPDCAYDLRNSAIVLRMRFRKYVAGVATALDHVAHVAGGPYTGQSFSYDAALRAIDTITISSNSNSSSSLEEFPSVSTNGSSITARLMSMFDHETANSSELFFHPTGESAIDNSVSLSAESYERAANYAASPTREFTKVIPLGVIFGSLDFPSTFINLRKIFINISLKNRADLGFGTADDVTLAIGTGGKPIVADPAMAEVTDIKLMVLSQRLTATQSAANAQLWASGSPENVGYLSRKSQSYQFANQTIMLGDVSGLNTLAFGIRAIDIAGIPFAVGAETAYCMPVNPSQWLPKTNPLTWTLPIGYLGLANAAPVDVTVNPCSQISSFSISVGSRQIPFKSVDMSLRGNEAVPYALYRQACFGGITRNLTPMVTLKQFETCYQLFFISVYGTLTMKAGDVPERTYLSILADNSAVVDGGAASSMSGKNILVVRQSFAASSILPTGEIMVLQAAN